MEREARHQSQGSNEGRKEDPPMSMLKVNNLSTSSDDGAGQMKLNQVESSTTGPKQSSFANLYSQSYFSSNT